jgi:hypothetical protein
MLQKIDNGRHNKCVLPHGTYDLNGIAVLNQRIIELQINL